jgi:acyl transferase domain-containing protein/acyl carrier protein
MSTSPERVAEALRTSLKETERLRLQNRRLVEAASEPIAIVGISCRYPGGADSPDALWRLLAAGGDAISAFPTDRGWDLESIFDAELEGFDSAHAREGGFLADAADFDPEFFGISPREALGMDPQQRLMLEASWEALEDAGIDPRSLRGTRSGVFAGAMYHDYGWGLSPLQESAAYLSTGGSSSLVSGRVAYTLGLEGPTLSVDTACSSSLVALHLAAQALRGGECSLALAGGVTVYSTPGVFIQFSRQRVLSPHGRSRAFADGADGAGFSEGVGMLVLERLGDAQRQGHTVLAMIRGSAVNQDGASNGIAAPNGPSQERVIRQALESARLSAEEIDAVEGHGTGTALGDPIEANALFATYGSERPAERPLRLGSIKSNIGHPQAAAGVAGVIKMVLALREGVLPKTLHVDEPSSRVDWSSGAIELLTEPAPWGPGERPRRAAVSSFGATGTNAHLILEEAPEPELGASGESVNGSDSHPAGSPLSGPLLLPLSAKTEPALRQAAGRLASHLQENPDLSLSGVGYSLALGRARLEQRAVVLGGERSELVEGLAALQRGEVSAAVAQGSAGGKSAVAFLFPGQGSQWRGMGAQLLSESAVFRHSMEQCDEALSAHLDWSVRDVVLGVEGAPSTDRIEVVQPVLFAVTVALAELWRACGVHPAAVAGHSQGEIAAAHVAGGLSLEDAARLAALRSQIIAKLSGQGAMASIALPSDQVASRIERWGGQIEVAAQNGPSSTIVAAGSEALGELLEQCEAEGIRAREVPATIPSHSARVEPLRDELLAALAPISPRSGDVPFYSTVTGEAIDTGELGPEYWYRNLRQPVRFEAVTRRLLEQGQRVLVEVSPHPVFALAVGGTIEDALGGIEEATVLGTLRRDEGGAERFALSLAEAHVAGVELDWDALFAGSAAGRVPLPTYPFQRKRYWLSSAEGKGDLSAAGLADAGHPLLGAVVGDPAGDGYVLTGRLSLSAHPWLADHAVAGAVLLPGTAFLELALRAAEEVGAAAIEELTLQAPMLLPEQGAVQVQVAVSVPDDRGLSEVSIHSRAEAGEDDGSEWICHAQGILTAEASRPPEPLGSWPPERAETLELEFLYDRLAEVGFEYGPAFQGVAGAWRDGDEIYVEARLAGEQAQQAQDFSLHPALLDSGGHPGIDIALAAGGASGEAALPFAWRGVSLYARGASALRMRLVSGEQGGGFDAYDHLGAPVASVQSVVMRPVDPAMLQAATRRRLPLHRPEWISLDSAQIAATDQPSLAILGQDEIEGLEAKRFPGLPALLEAIAAGTPAPKVLLLDERAAGGEALPAAAHARTQRTLELAQSFLAAEELAGARLCLLTAGAVAIGQGEAPNLTSAPLWGLLRSAHSEHPGRFALIDTDDSEASAKVLGDALAAGTIESQIALREGEALVPRLARVEVPEEPVANPIDPERTVLITGGTSGIGALLARHLVQEHGARHLLLASRRGRDAEGAGDLQTELEELGAQVTVAACDVAERPQLEALLDSIPAEHPLGAIFHSAGVLDDGLLDSLDAERLARVMRPKVDAAWHLHELSAGAGLSAFVLFSSIMGVLGGAAQANYAAANAFLDALAAHRRAGGLPATSLAWGGWAQQSVMVDGSQGRAELERIVAQIRKRLGLVPMPPEQGLALLDAALALPDSQLVPVAFDPTVLRAQATAGTLPAVLRGLVRVPANRERERGSLAERLASVPEAEREALVLDLVRGHVAAVLGHSSAAAVEPERAFKDLGFDSLAAVELRNRLVAATGLRLVPTIVFDYPSPASLAQYMSGEATGKAEKVTFSPRAAAASAEPIAIVGMACRYPGEASSPAALWELLVAGRDAISGFPEDRGWDLERLYSADPDEPGTCYAREGGFVYDAADFDPGFFGISPREAQAMDPQERVLLEACWEAFEDGGIDPRRLRGTETGVFAGVMYQDYGVADHGMGMTSAGVSGRVAYTFGLEGPTMTVDTACSSSLVAMHLAGQALRGGECSLALAGGVTVLSTPGVLNFFSRQRGLAIDGRSKAFSESANGTSISEGTGVLLLECLSDAERNGHPILATIRGSAVNQDGASNGFTAPNGPSQERVIRQALANAGLDPGDIDAVEAHGTGTALGDPIEAGALLATYGQDRERPLKLGSVKSNIGHPQAAAGVAGAIKMVMAMREGVLPKTLHIDQPSTKVDWEAGEIELLTEAQPWERNGGPRRAGVSSFGASGTNAHLILEEAIDAGPGEGERGSAGQPERDGTLPVPLLLSLSAKTEAALGEVADRLAVHLAENPEVDPLDIAYSLATTRTQLEQRAVVIGSDRDQLLRGLAAAAKGEAGAGVALGRAGRGGKLAYLFSGQGSQRPGMGGELYAAFPVFAEAFDRVCEPLDAELGLSLREIVFDSGEGAAERLAETSFAQPALFATEVALFRLLESFGLAPDFLAGHSIGELSAAHLAGVFSLSDAARLVVARGRLMGELPDGGSMLALQATEGEVRETIRGSEAELSIAAINGPRSVVLSGAEGAIATAQEHWRSAGCKTKRLTVSHAFHSPLIEPMLEQFELIARELEYREPRIPIVSNLSGGLLTPEQATDPAYWVSHARQPVRFADAVRTLRQQGVTTFLELGPEAVLSAMAQECVESDQADPAAVFVPSLRTKQPEPATVALAIASAHANGIALDWEAFFAPTAARRVTLPTYPFQRKRYWLDSTQGGVDPSATGQVPADHPLLGASIAVAGGEGLLLTGRVSRSTHPWLADHALGGTVLLPGTALVELALRAGAEVEAEMLEELALQAPLVLPERGGVQIQVSLAGPDDEGRREVSIHSRAEDGEEAIDQASAWTCNAQGILAPGSFPVVEPLRVWPPQGAESLDVDGLYERLADHGIDYGPAFRAVRAAWRLGDELLVEVSLPEEQVQEARRFGLHPALFDAAGHVGVDLALAPGSADGGEPGELALPFAWRGVRIISSGASSLRVRVELAGEGRGLVAFDQAGEPVVSVDSLTLRPLERGQLPPPRRRLPLHQLEWIEAGAGSVNGSEPARLAILGDATGGPPTADRHADLSGLLEAIDGGTEVPEIVLVAIPGDRGEDGLVERSHRCVGAVLELLQAWSADERLGESRLCIQTGGAIAVAAGESPDLASAAVWGLLRSAQSEHPGRFGLIDTDGEAASLQALPAALAATAVEAQIALRAGRTMLPRLARVEFSAGEDDGPRIDPASTVLITGGTGGLGALLARYLASEHGARHLLLISRRGPEADGASELLGELRGLGAEPEIVACDASDRAQLSALLDSIPAEHPLGAVIHSAGVVDDGLFESLDAGRLDRVLAAKLDGAWHLHELTAEMALSHFVMFSSVAGILGTPGQANYAAANSFLDALASHRSAAGLPATSLAWGAWAQATGMTGELGEADVGRVRRLGLAAISPQLGLELFDAACLRGEPLLAPVAFDASGLRARAAAGTLPAVLTGLAGPVSAGAAERQSLSARLAGVPVVERERVVLELVRGHVAAVLGHASAAEVDPEAAFMDLGFDSLAAIELRNRLNAATGLRLQPTVVFDYPSTAAVARHLLDQVSVGLGAGGQDGSGNGGAEDALAKLTAMLPALKADDRLRDRVGDGLRALLADLSAPDLSEGEDLASMSHEEMFELIDEEFGA